MRLPGAIRQGQSDQWSFPEEERRKKGQGRKHGPEEKVLDGTVCPLCGKGKLRESPLAFSCTETGCKCTVWKDMLSRGNGPQITEKLLRLILEKGRNRGSTGTIGCRRAGSPGGSAALLS